MCHLPGDPPVIYARLQPRRTADWRSDETLIAMVEQVCKARKALHSLSALAPSDGWEEAWEGQVHFLDDSTSRESLWLRAHREQDGTIILVLSMGTQVIRRGHIGGNHMNPGGRGRDLIKGPHIHFPTSVFRDLRRGRSRAHEWPIDHSVSLREALSSFADALNILGPVEEKRPLFGGTDGV